MNKKDPTTLVDRPIYKFNDVEEFSIVPSDHVHVSIELFNYQDLITVIKNKDNSFFESYIASVRKSFVDKRIKYSEKLRLAQDILSRKPDSGALASYDESIQAAKLCVEEYSDVLDCIDSSESYLNIDRLKDNFTDMIWNRNSGLETMIGRVEIKDFLARDIYAFKQDPTNFYTTFQNGLILGSSGMGKDKLAICMAHTYHMGCITLRPGHIMMSKDDISSPFVGASGNKARSAFLSGIEKVQFLNEIYDLEPAKGFMGVQNSAGHGKDVINQLVYFTDEHRGESRIFGMGYEKETLERFLGANEGMDRRFPSSRRIVLLKYSNEELTNILVRQMADLGSPTLSNDEVNMLHSLIVSVNKKAPEVFKVQAGAMFNIASHIVTVLNTMKDNSWRVGDSIHNKQLLRNAFNNYLSKNHKIASRGH